MPVSGGQSIRYTPPAGFGGTEQFGYTIQDGLGLVSQATVTVNMLPDSLNDDLAELLSKSLMPRMATPSIMCRWVMSSSCVCRWTIYDPGFPMGLSLRSWICCIPRLWFQPLTVIPMMPSTLTLHSARSSVVVVLQAG